MISSSICKNASNYLCLFDAPRGSYRQECQGPKLMETGFKWVWEPNFNRGECDLERYQPFIFNTERNTDCVYLKVQCYSEGQITVNNGSNKENRQCHCDVSGGYTLVKPADNAVCCLPSVEDCSCYKSQEREINGSQNVHTMQSYGNKQVDLANHVEAYNDPRYNITYENYKRKTFWCIFILLCVILMACALFPITFLWRKQRTSARTSMQYKSSKHRKMENMASHNSTLVYPYVITDSVRLVSDEFHTGNPFFDKMGMKINEELTYISFTNAGSLDEEKVPTKHSSKQTEISRSEICINNSMTNTKTTNINDFHSRKQLVPPGIFEETYKTFESESFSTSTIASLFMPLIISRVNVKDRSIMRKCFLDNERCVFKKDLSDPLRYLETLFQCIQTSGNQSNLTTCNMTQIYDQYVAFAAFTIDDFTNKTNDIDPESNLYNYIEAIASKTSCPDVTRCMLDVRKAVAYSFKKNRTEGENMKIKALIGLVNVGPCLEIVDVLYKLVLFSRAWYEHNPDEVLAFIIECRKKALDTLAALSLDDDQRYRWQQRFDVRLLFCYVGIGMRGKFISTYKLKSTHENEANTLLAKLNTSDSNSRLQMLVNVAKSRLYQLHSEFEEAIFYNKKAQLVAIEKNYCERKEIRKNAKQLRQHYIKNS